MTPEALAARSVSVIRAHQHESGAYLAAPFPAAYRNAWLRDGAFVADAMSALGERASAERFFSWCAGIVESRAARMGAGEILDGRYTPDGHEVPGRWSAAQLDGFGSWVWALGRHVRRHGADPTPWREAAGLSLRFAADCWSLPCYDWWEERWGVHVATLAALHAGLTSGVVGEPWATEAAAAIRAAVVDEGVGGGRLVACLGEGGLDASLLAVSTPFGLLEPDDPLVGATVGAVEAGLVPAGGGVHRHPEDEFYGGGLWLLLAALLGLHYARVGRVEEARRQLDWIAARATKEGDLPEQVDDHLLRPEKQAEWLERWGPSSCPLLWSHAFFVTLAIELGAVSGRIAA
ncbi:MAG TPA: glycoside hydrolase family 15 protein [Gaiellaceae bacterium]|nr:glycoside hydrolase family 15 protein [Gaiellaceae bacterium]